MDEHLEMYTSQLHESVTVRNITFAGDIPQVVDIVQGIIDLLDGDEFMDLPVSYKVTLAVAQPSHCSIAAICISRVALLD